MERSNEAWVGVIPGPARDPRIDALRGFALLGILLVNIQSFISGAPNAIGYLAPDSGAADRIAYFLTATFVVGKFMPLFGMLFGASFALLYDKLRASFAQPQRLYRRRLVFLMAFGLLHALFLYFGDITLAYAIAGFVLLRHADSDASQLARATARWWIFAAVWLLLSMLSSSGRRDATPQPLADAVERNEEAAMTLGYWAQWPLRAEMALWQMQANLLGLPSLIALMMTGALAQRAGWLRNLDAPVWRRAADSAWQSVCPPRWRTAGGPSLMRNWTKPGDADRSWDAGGSVTLAFFYTSTLPAARTGPSRRVARAGRTHATHQLPDAVAGDEPAAARLGARTRRGVRLRATERVAVAVFVVQTLVSHWWLAHFEQGPLEAIWRAWTYRGAELRVPERQPSDSGGNLVGHATHEFATAPVLMILILSMPVGR